MNNFLKAYGVLIGIITVICLMFFLIYKQNEISNRQATIEQSIVAQKQLADGITRAMAEYATKKDIETFAANSDINLDPIKQDLDNLHAKIDAIGKVTIVSTGYTNTDIASTTVIKNPDQVTAVSNTIDCNGQKVDCYKDDFGYQKNTQVLNVEEKFDTKMVPMAEVKFSAWKPKPWELNVPTREYNVVTVIGKDSNDRDYAYNKFSIKVNDKVYDVPIKTSQIVQQYPDPSFSLWNPRLFIGYDVGTSLSFPKLETQPGIHIGIMSYGKSKIQPDWSFLQVGAVYAISKQTVGVSITPAAYNIGQHIPFMRNLYIAPSMTMTSKGVGVFGGIRVGL